MTIKTLLQARRKADFTFHYAKNLYSGKYYLQNQLIFRFALDTPEANIHQCVDYYVDATNTYMASIGRSQRATLETLTIGLDKDKTVKVVLATGSDISLIMQGGGISAKGGGTNPPPPPPPPIMGPIDFGYDHILSVVAFNTDLSTHNAVQPESLFMYNMMSTGI